MSQPRRQSDNNPGRKSVAAAVSIGLHVLVGLLLVVMFLEAPSASDRSEREWPPVDSAELLLGGEYVMVGDIPEPGVNDAPAPPQEAAEPAPDPNPTSPEPTPQVVSSNQPSPAKANKAAEAKKRDDELKRQAQKAEQERRANEINSRVAFGKGKSGQPDGNSVSGAVSGVAADGLGNRQTLALPKPSRGPLGTIKVRIKVNRDGVVTAATYLSGSGAAAADAATRQACVAAARRAKFSADPSAPASQSGTLTYNYK